MGGVNMEANDAKISVHKISKKKDSFTLYIGYIDKDEPAEKIGDDMVSDISSIEIPSTGLVGVIKGLVKAGVDYQRESGKEIGFRFSEETDSSGNKNIHVQF